jgi:ribonucleoside-diphosphate reductase beta chain
LAAKMPLSSVCWHFDLNTAGPYSCPVFSTEPPKCFTISWWPKHIPRMGFPDSRTSFKISLPTEDGLPDKITLSDSEKEVVKRSLLGIAQVEVGVKTFWGDLYKLFPKPEINGLGSTFAECEFRHSEAYSRLLEVLGFNDEFEKLLTIEVFKEKLNLINQELSNDKNIIDKLIFFTLVIENSSLFSQFANILSFTRFRGQMKNVSNIIAWTSVDEQIHANAGIFLINKLIEEGHEIDSEHIKEVVLSYMNYEENQKHNIYVNNYGIYKR